MQWLLGGGALVVAFLGGLLAPAAGNAVNAFVNAKIGRAERSRDQADSRSRQAAEVCFEDLAKINVVIPEYASLDRRTSAPSASPADYEALRDAKASHEALIASLEANTVLLRAEVRPEMETVVDILRFAYDLPYRSNPQGQLDVGWHPDNASTIASELVRHARAVLASHLTNSTIPARSDAFAEYLLANDERNQDLSDYFSEYIEEDGEAVQKWRTKRGLPPQRRPPKTY